MFFYLEIYIIITKFNKTFNCKTIKFFATGYMNRLTYLYQNGNYWSMSPGIFNSGSSYARGFIQHATGDAPTGWVTDGIGLRPVINLQSDVTISGQVILI